MVKSVPIQYKEKIEGLIYAIGKLSDELWIFSSELGDNVEIEDEKYKLTISKKSQD